MTSISISRGIDSGFETVEVNTGKLALTLIPALGGKVSSLRDMRTGREWLWRNPRLSYRRVSHGSSYGQYGDTGGWDECFPSVDQCQYPSPPWAGAPIQDHGELWSQAAELEIRADVSSVALMTRWQGVALPYTLERTITARAGSSTLQFAYTVQNTGDTAIEWIWSAHPLMAIEPDMQVLVPTDARFNLRGTFPPGLVREHTHLAFPLRVGAFDLTELPPTNAGIALKLWSDPLIDGCATLRAADGEFRMRWDANRLPQLGLWLNLGMWAGDGGAPYYNLGLEPCIGAQDSLYEAVTQYHLFETLDAASARSWSLEVELAVRV